MVCFDVRAIAFYLVAYLLMTLLSFAVLIIVAQQTGEEISDFDGLAKRSPFLAFAMLIGMVSLAGVPFTAGFLGKFYIFYAAVAQHQIALVVVGVITVGCGFYYYLKVVRAMYWQSDSNTDTIPVSGLVARRDQRVDYRDDLAGRLSATDSGSAEALRRCNTGVFGSDAWHRARLIYDPQAAND